MFRVLPDAYTDVPVGRRGSRIELEKLTFHGVLWVDSDRAPWEGPTFRPSTTVLFWAALTTHLLDL